MVIRRLYSTFEWKIALVIDSIYLLYLIYTQIEKLEFENKIKVCNSHLFHLLLLNIR